MSPEQVDLRFTRPHLSCGPGARVDTPVGPIRVDLGFKMARRASEGRSVLHFSIGQAF